MLKRLLMICSAGLMILALAGCANPTAASSPTPPPSATPSPEPTVTATPEFTESLMAIDSVTMRLLEGEPAQAHIAGSLADACTSFSRAEQSLDGNRLIFVVWTSRPTHLLCNDQPRHYERDIQVEMPLPPGEYVIVANGAEAAFEVVAGE